MGEETVEYTCMKAESWDGLTSPTRRIKELLKNVRGSVPMILFLELRESIRTANSRGTHTREVTMKTTHKPCPIQVVGCMSP